MPDPEDDKTTHHQDRAREARQLNETLMSYIESHIRSDVATIFQLLDRYAQTLDAPIDKAPDLISREWEGADGDS